MIFEKVDNLTKVKVLLWASVFFALINTFSSALFALQVGVLEPQFWSEPLFDTFYKYQNNQAGLWALIQAYVVYLFLPFAALPVFAYLIFFTLKKLGVFQTRVFKAIFSGLISLKLAVFVILIVGTISAIGTFVEASYDAKMAGRLVYHSVYMYTALFIMSLQLIAVMIDRWPWKMRHASFVLAHIGILFLLYGSLLTRYFGVDGSMIFEIGQTSNYVTLNKQEFVVYSSFGDTTYSLMSKERVDFFKIKPTKENPYIVQLGAQKLKVTDYYHYAVRKSQIKSSSDKLDNPAARIQLTGSRANVAKWLWAQRGKSKATTSLGPLDLVMSKTELNWDGKNNLIHLQPLGDEMLSYAIYSVSRGGKINSGKIKIGDVIATGFMDFELRLINYFSNATETVEYEERQYPSEITQAAVRVEFDNESHWLGLNNLLRLYSNTQAYVVSYANNRINVGFPMTLNKFDVGHYQGTKKAMTYESIVDVPKLGQQTISMNEPLKHNGFTFYQASFEQDEAGNPVASILSVNKDPGRFLKYAGCLILVLGAILLFYFRKVVAKMGKV